MLKLFVNFALISAAFSFAGQASAAADCSKDLARLITAAKRLVNPTDSDFHAVVSSVRLKAHLILQEELDSSADQTWWQPNGQYFKGAYQSKRSKKSVIAIFDREAGLWAYQVNSSNQENVCIGNRHISKALSDLGSKKE